RYLSLLDADWLVEEVRLPHIGCIVWIREIGIRAIGYKEVAGLTYYNLNYSISEEETDSDLIFTARSGPEPEELEDIRTLPNDTSIQDLYSSMSALWDQLALTEPATLGSVPYGIASRF
ncbi:hypothetical protein Tco_1098207, partial [Tanacetum coccineum]